MSKILFDKRGQNLNNFSWAELTAKETEIKPINLKAYCTSYVCCRDKTHSKKLGTPVNAPKSQVFCKECGNALFWVKNNEHRVAEKEKNSFENKFKFC